MSTLSSMASFHDISKKIHEFHRFKMNIELMPCRLDFGQNNGDLFARIMTFSNTFDMMKQPILKVIA